jgi:S-adenosylmethionine:tRNA ribosyltransferase-isomerase
MVQADGSTLPPGFRSVHGDGKRDDDGYRLAAYDYELPPELIAQQPIEPRDAARLLVFERGRPGLAHAHIRDLPRLLAPGDLLVLNDSRVMPARLRGQRAGGGAAELLLVARRAAGLWEALGRPARRLRVGTVIELSSPAAPRLNAIIEEVLEGSRRLVRFVAAAGDVDALALAHGQVPLPPYIRAPLGDPERYQTIYARAPGSVAAPTAGLHFTPALFAALAARGIRWVALTLHVGPGTFQPVRAADVRQHRLVPEWAALSAEAAEAINATKRAGRRVVAIGTTVTRALEVAARRAPRRGGEVVRPFTGPADLFIYPPFTFRAVDALLTNFHLPRSTLLMLVSAFAGRERILAAYEEAKAAGYRFYSFGDAMLIL